MVIDSVATYNSLTFTEDGIGLFAIAFVTSNSITELLWIIP